MKKLFILLLLPFFIACSSDDDNTNPPTEPQKGDEMTIEQIAGTYKASKILFDNTDTGFFNENLELTFNADKTGEEWNPTTLEKTPFTWNYKDRVISFSYSLHKNINGWFDKTNLCYKANYINENGEQTKFIGTHIFIKK